MNQAGQYPHAKAIENTVFQKGVDLTPEIMFHIAFRHTYLGGVLQVRQLTSSM